MRLRRKRSRESGCTFKDHLFPVRTAHWQLEMLLLINSALRNVYIIFNNTSLLIHIRKPLVTKCDYSH